MRRHKRKIRGTWRDIFTKRIYFMGEKYTKRCLLPLIIQFSTVQSLSRVQLFATPWTTHAGLLIYHELPESTQTYLDWVGDTIQPSHPLSSPSPPAFSLSQHHGLFKWVSSSYQVSKVLDFQLRHQSCQWIFRTNSFRVDWLDLLAVQGTLKSLLQHHSSKASIFRHSAFLIVQLSHPYMTTEKP